MGADLRWERLNVVQPPSPTGSFTFSNLFTDLPGTANTGTPFASFSSAGIAVLDRSAAGDSESRALPGRASSRTRRVNDRLTVNGGVRYTLNFPSVEKNDQGGRLQPRDARARVLGRDGSLAPPSCTG